MLDDLRSVAVEISTRGLRQAAVPGLRVYRETSPTASVPVVFNPVVYVVLQGTKQLLLDDRVVRYDEAELVVATMSLPALAQVVAASPEEPYLAVEIDVDRSVLVELMTEIESPASRSREVISVHPTPVEIYDPLLRLLHLTADPRAARLFAASAVREILYHLLLSPQGSALRQMADFHSPVAQAAHAASLMAHNLDEPLDVAQLAAGVGMSVTSLHRHFKAATGTAPSTYYKRLRLHEARRLGVGTALNVTEVSAAVGFASVAHFSRDYKNLFGESPRRDFARLREPNAGPAGDEAAPLTS